MANRILHTLISYLCILAISLIILKSCKIYSSHYMINDEPDKIIQFPSSIKDVTILAKVAKKVYIPNHFEYMSTMFFVGYLHLQIFSNPESLYLTLLSPHLFEYVPAVMVCVTLQTVGSCGSYLISGYFWKPAARWIITGKIEMYLNQAEKFILSQSWFTIGRYLIAARICPLIPNWPINIFTPQIGVSFCTFLVTSFLGNLLYTPFIVFFGTEIDNHNSVYNIVVSNKMCFSLYLDLLISSICLAVPYSFVKNYGKRETKNPARRDRKEMRNKKRR